MHNSVDSQYIVSAPWQSGLGMGNPIGQILGSLAVAWPMERYGRRWTLAACCALNAAFIFMQVRSGESCLNREAQGRFRQFFAPSVQVLCAGEILAGLMYGGYVVIAPSYASEVCPLALRGILTAFVNLAFVIGQFLAQGVTTGESHHIYFWPYRASPRRTGFASRTDSWAYRGPFAVQWVWPLVLIIGLIFAPESPWWLVRQGRSADAEESLRRLVSDPKADVKQLLTVIEQTDRLERELESGSSYANCFRGANLRRTEISIGVYLIQVPVCLELL
jgi:MFS transporter, SP family, general alpha glucoside:H+ symporter